MSVPSSPVYVKYTANGATTVFAYPFKMQDAAQLEVLLNDVVQGSGFTVSGVGNDGGGNVTFSSAPANGVVVYLRRNSDMDRETAYSESNFLVNTVNNDQDYQTMLVQEINDKADRSLHVQQGSAVNTEMPSPQANYLLAWNSGGDALVNVQSFNGALSNVDYKFSSVAAMSAQTGMADGALAITYGYYANGDGGHGQYRYDASSVAAVNGGTVINAASGIGRWILLGDSIINVRQFGAKGDGSTDDTSAIQAAIDYAATIIQNIIPSKVDFVNASVRVPSGRFKHNATIVIKEGVKLKGDSKSSSMLVSAGLAIAVQMGGASREHSSVVLENICVAGDGVTATTKGVYFERCIRSSYIRDCQIFGFGYNVYGVNTWALQILDNFIHDALKNNIFWTESTACTIRRNRLDGALQENIVLDGQSASELITVTIADNAIQGATHNGIKIIDAENITLQGNFFESNNQAASTYGDVLLIPGSRSVKTRIFMSIGNFFTVGSAGGTSHRALDIRSAYTAISLGDQVRGGTFDYGILSGATVDNLIVRSAFSVGVADISANSSTIVDTLNGSNKYALGAPHTPSARRSLKSAESAAVLEALENTSATSGSVALQLKAGDTGANTFLIYGLDSAGTNTFRVTANGDTRNLNNIFGAISDARLKDIIGPASSAIDDFKAYEFVKYKLKGDENVQLGVIAQQVAEVSPGLVSLSPMYKDGEGGEKEYVGDFYDVKYSVLYLKACVALQELIGRVERLEARALGASN